MTSSPPTLASSAALDETVKAQRRQVIERMEHSAHSPQEAWDALWKDRLTPWDLGQPTPILVHELDTFLTPRLQQGVPIEP
jgi:hypothetical protein